MQEHHALLVYAQNLESAAIPEQLKKQSADVQHHLRNSLSIDDVRELIRSSIQAPVSAPVRTFVIQAHQIAIEAQHALLKLLEEPPRRVQFYVILPKTALILPTLRSRLMELNSAPEGSKENESFAAFLSASAGERLALIAQKTKDKDQVWIDAVLEGSESLCAESPERTRNLLGAVMFARSHIGARGASAKMLLEEVALHL